MAWRWSGERPLISASTWNSAAIRSSASLAIADPVAACTSNSFLRLCAQHATSTSGVVPLASGS
jgi:hypothetical protein